MRCLAVRYLFDCLVSQFGAPAAIHARWLDTKYKYSTLYSTPQYWKRGRLAPAPTQTNRGARASSSFSRFFNCILLRNAVSCITCKQSWVPVRGCHLHASLSPDLSNAPNPPSSGVRDPFSTSQPSSVSGRRLSPPTMREKFTRFRILDRCHN